MVVCGLHLLVGMADVAAITLLEWESTRFEGAVGAAALSLCFKKSESVNSLSYSNCMQGLQQGWL